MAVDTLDLLLINKEELDEIVNDSLDCSNHNTGENVWVAQETGLSKHGMHDISNIK